MPAAARADLLLDLRRFADAAVAARAAVAEEPDAPAGHLHLARALGGKGRWADAAAAARDGLRHAPADAWGHRVLGWALAGLGKYHDAAGAYREAVRLDPHDAFGWGGLAHALWATGEYEGAHAAAVAGLQHHPTDEFVLSQLGHAERRLGRAADARATAERGLRLHPAGPRFWHLRGCVLWDAADAVPVGGNWRRAYPDLREAVRLAPGDACYRADLRRFVGDWRRRVLQTLPAGLVGGAFGVALAVGQPAAVLPLFVLVACTVLPLPLLADDTRCVQAAPLGWLGVPAVPPDPEERRPVWAWRLYAVAAVVMPLAAGAGGLLGWWR